MYVVSEKSIEQFLCKISNLKDEHNKRIHLNVMELAKEWFENAIDYEMVIRTLEEIRDIVKIQEEEKHKISWTDANIRNEVDLKAYNLISGITEIGFK